MFVLTFVGSWPVTPLTDFDYNTDIFDARLVYNHTWILFAAMIKSPM